MNGETTVGAHYIDELALAIFRQAENAEVFSWADDPALYRLYALLCLVVGEATTNENVHDAWSAWCASTRPDHGSLVPFSSLEPRVQDLDAPYRDAIRTVARRIAGVY
jgi:hypothetical protein